MLVGSRGVLDDRAVCCGALAFKLTHCCLFWWRILSHHQCLREVQLQIQLVYAHGMRAGVMLLLIQGANYLGLALMAVE